MSLIAKFAAKKAASAPTTAPAATVEAETQVHMPTVETNPAPVTTPKRAYTRKVVAEAPAPQINTMTAEERKGAAPQTAPVATRTISVFDPFSIITGQGGEDASSVLEMVLAKAEESGNDGSFDGPFPLVKLLKGNSGGSWTFGSNVDGEAAGVLPVAKNPFTAIFLGYYIYGVAWETGQMGHADAGGDANKAKPIWKVKVGSADKALVSAAMDAGEAYQFTPGKEKGKFDGLGHFRPGVEMLFYRKGIIFAMRLPDHFSTSIRSLESLGGVMRGLGGLRAVPVVVTPYSTDEKGAVPWKCHAVRVDLAVTPEGKALAAEFESIKADLVADAEFGPTFKDWNTTVVDADAEAALKEIASMKKAR